MSETNNQMDIHVVVFKLFPSLDSVDVNLSLTVG